MKQEPAVLTSKPVADLELELRKVRQNSLIATRKGDFRTVARLTIEAARLKRQMDLESGF